MADLIPIIIPRTSANDDMVKILFFHVGEGDSIAANQLVAEVETSKAVIEIEAPCAGVVLSVAQVGDDIDVGNPVAVIAPEGLSGDDLPAKARKMLGGKPADKAPAAKPAKAMKPQAAPARSTPARPAPASAEARPAASRGTQRFSRAARAAMERHGFSEQDFCGVAMVTGEIVAARAEGRAPMATGSLFARPCTTPGRIAVIGAGSGANQILSSLLAAPDSDAAGIYDDDTRKADQTVYGVPVRGNIEDLFADLERGEVDAMILATSNHPKFRQGILDTARSRGFAMANVIHPTAAFDINVRLGMGCYIGAFCYFGAETTIGDNCYLSSRTTIEHHNVVGDGVTTGPSVATSGHVTIGSNVRFGTGIGIEPGLTIGDGAVIASGMTLIHDIDANQVIKATSRQRGGPLTGRNLVAPWAP